MYLLRVKSWVDIIALDTMSTPKRLASEPWSLAETFSPAWNETRWQCNRKSCQAGGWHGQISQEHHRQKQEIVHVVSGWNQRRRFFKRDILHWGNTYPIRLRITFDASTVKTQKWFLKTSTNTGAFDAIKESFTCEVCGVWTVDRHFLPNINWNSARKLSIKWMASNESTCALTVPKHSGLLVVWINMSDY